jgi:hypothetical protein
MLKATNAGSWIAVLALANEAGCVKQPTMSTGSAHPPVEAEDVNTGHPAADADSTDLVCGYFKSFPKLPGGPQIDTGWVCSEGGLQSSVIRLGDDDGQGGQTLRLFTTSAHRLCMRHQAYSPDPYGWTDTGWQCAEKGRTSPPMFLGDDSGWIHQKLQILNMGPTEVCFRHTRFSQQYGSVDTGMVCSRNGAPSAETEIGDDSGWRNQSLYLEARQ